MSYLVAFDLEDDLRHPGCPVCRVAARVGQEYLRSLMASDITDARVADALRRSGGLCREHLLLAAEVAEDGGDSMGMALLCELLMAAAETSLTRRARARARARRRQAPEWLVGVRRLQGPHARGRGRPEAHS